VRFSLLCLLTAGLSTAQVAPQAAIYHDQDLDFSFRYPGALRVNEEVRHKAVLRARNRVQDEAEASKALSCLQTQLVAVENPGTSTFRVLAITRLDLDCRNEAVRSVKLDELTKDGLRTAMMMLGHPVIGKASGYKILEHPASVVDGSIDPQASVSKGPILGEMVCAIIEHSVVCFSALGTDRTRVRQVMEDGITFAGREQQPLVSAGLLSP